MVIIEDMDSRYGYRVLSLLLFLLSGCVSVFGGRKNDREIFISCEIDRDALYENESAVLSTYLYSLSPDIAYGDMVSPLGLDHDEFSYISKVRTNRRPFKEKIGSKTYNVFPLESYVIMLEDKGNYVIGGGVYEIGVNVPVVIDDPFWGRRHTVSTERRSVRTDPLKLKVKELPVHHDGSVVSGAVGTFNVSVEIPPGNIFMNQAATAIVTLKGSGFLGPDIMPEYRSAFGNGTRLKSVADSRDVYFDGKDLVSVVSLECEFIPLEKNVSIGPVSFVYFNPHTGRYEKVESDPVTVSVRSIADKSATTDV